MDLLISANTVAQAQADTAPATGTPGWATDGDPAQGIIATDSPAWHYNMMMAELIAFVKAAGITPSNSDWSQTLKAAQILFAPAQRGVAPYNAALATLIGGYPKFAVVVDAAGAFWVSTADANMTVPGATGANWTSLFASYTTTTDGDYRYARTGGAGDLQTGHKIYIGFNGTRMVGIVDTTEFGNIAFSNQFVSASSKVFFAATSDQSSTTLTYTAPVSGTFLITANANVGVAANQTQPDVAEFGIFLDGNPTAITSDTTSISMSHCIAVPVGAGAHTISAVYAPTSQVANWHSRSIALTYLFIPS
ncbi:hypothetical protein K2X14_07645 [Acetobacter sp. TBRC 12305]|uniref:Uncharacterized protein n=1 Tax=Acetobacter garciniae TaxID=2817435 RepID=A0A939HP41_9PROT|nr:hypothetical protein [Acetobacter garciniae]MBO1325323.1 hypothetical protein [Acetobacter garciniae]MBX0344705.1 hypothetical protein [Acetobacter garciniae]